MMLAVRSCTSFFMLLALLAFALVLETVAECRGRFTNIAPGTHVKVDQLSVLFFETVDCENVEPRIQFTFFDIESGKSRTIWTSPSPMAPPNLVAISTPAWESNATVALNLFDKNDRKKLVWADQPISIVISNKALLKRCGPVSGFSTKVDDEELSQFEARVISNPLDSVARACWAAALYLNGRLHDAAAQLDHAVDLSRREVETPQGDMQPMSMEVDPRGLNQFDPSAGQTGDFDFVHTFRLIAQAFVHKHDYESA